jgi:hypothetical protein
VQSAAGAMGSICLAGVAEATSLRPGPDRDIFSCCMIRGNGSASAIDPRQLRRIVPRMAAGWNIRVTSFDSEGKPRIVRNFLAYESDKEKAIELVRKRVPVNEGELAEPVAEVAGNEFVGPGMRPGDVRRYNKKADLDEG